MKNCINCKNKKVIYSQYSIDAGKIYFCSLKCYHKFGINNHYRANYLINIKSQKVVKFREKKHKLNRITCKCVKGIYKDKDIEIKIGEHANETQVLVNGKPIDLVQSIHIKIVWGRMTTLQIETIKNKEE